MTSEQQKKIIRNWTIQYAVVLSDDLWAGRLLFGAPVGYVYTARTKDRSDVLGNTYNLIYRSVRASVENIEIGR